MEIAPNQDVAPRLLDSDVCGFKAIVDDEPANVANVKRSGIFGSRPAIFIGIIVGALLICGLAVFFATRPSAEPETPAKSERLIPVSGTPSPVIVATPPPLWPSRATSIEVTPDMLKVSAISLGHPRLAVINHQQVAEGDWVTVQTANARVAVKLHIIKILDGRIELNVGNQTITVPITQLNLKRK